MKVDGYHGETTPPFFVVEFFFTPSQRLRALEEARRRQESNQRLGRKGRNNGPEKGPQALEKHKIGAGAELAVAAYLGLEEFVFKDTNPVRGSSDLPGGIDVKCRPCHNWDLLVQLDDDLDKTYVLVTIQNRRIFIHGWIHGSMIPRECVKEYSPGRPCYSIPQSLLKPIEDLNVKRKLLGSS